jgi:hypothetical protein
VIAATPTAESSSIVPDDRLRSAAASAAIGVPELRYTIEKAHDDFVNRQVTGYREARDSFRKQIAFAMLHGNVAEAEELRMRARGQGMVFTDADVQRAIESFSQPAEERRARRTPLDLRGEMRDFYAQ